MGALGRRMKCMKMIGGKGEYAILDQLLEVVACDLLSDGHRLLGWLALALITTTETEKNVRKNGFSWVAAGEVPLSPALQILPR